MERQRSRKASKIIDRPINHTDGQTHAPTSTQSYKAKTHKHPIINNVANKKNK